jgi:ribosome-associated protein
MATDYENIARLILSAAEEKKGQNPVTLDVRGLSTVTDFFVILSGSSAPHLKALEQEISRRMKAEGHPAHRSSGSPESGWIVIDFFGVVAHIFTPETRAYYALENLWSDAPRRGRSGSRSEES